MGVKLEKSNTVHVTSTLYLKVLVIRRITIDYGQLWAINTRGSGRGGKLGVPGDSMLLYEVISV
jgi:hypothetical protein